MEHIWWYVARATGLLAWAGAAASILVGLCLSTGLVSAKTLRSTHNWLAGITVSLIGLHLIGLAADDYVDFGWADLFIPGASSWDPAAVAWGIVAFWVLAAVILTSLMRRWLSPRSWRGIHLLSVVVYFTATVHALTAGSDLGVSALTWLVVLTTVVITGSVLFRLAQAAAPGARARLARARRQLAASGTRTDGRRPTQPAQRAR